MSDNNQLKIKARSLDLELKGEPEYVEMAYRAVRDVLMERFRESLEARAETEPADRATSELPVITPEQLRQQKPEPRHAHLVLCNEVYNKVYLIDGDRGIRGALGRVLNLDHIGRIYINRAQQDAFTDAVNFDRVLWRELTTAGRDAVRKGR